MVDQTLEFFDFQAPLYDAYQRNCIPKYDEMISISVGFLRHVLAGHDNLALLDLGCGTGNTALALTDLFPRASVHCVDGSEAMLAEAKKKLNSKSEAAVRFSRKDLADQAWSNNLNGAVFDAAVSVLVLEHIPFGAYRRLLGDLRGLIKPGGWLVTVEAFTGDMNHRIIYAEMEHLAEKAVRSGLIPLEWMKEMKRLSKDKETHYFASMSDKKRWWMDAGYQEVDFIWQYYCVGILVGRNAAGVQSDRPRSFSN